MSVCANTPARRFPKALIGAVIAAVVGIPLVIGLLSTSNTRAADGEFAGGADAVQGTMMTMAQQAGAPARLLEATFGVKDLLLRAKLENAGSRAITQYQIGWVIVYRDGKIDVSSGEVMNVPAQVAPGTVAEVPDQGVSGKVLNNKPREIMFFVAEARFSSGEVWKADTRPIAIEAHSKAQTAASVNDPKTEKTIMCAFADVKYPEGSVIQEGNGPEQMCVRVLDSGKTRRTGRRVFYPSWIFTSKAIRNRSITVVHLPVPPVAFCTPKAPVGTGLCSCEEGGVSSLGAIINSTRSPFQLRCGDDGNWIQTKTPNVVRR